jgi:hypothetical protein
VHSLSKGYAQHAPITGTPQEEDLTMCNITISIAHIVTTIGLLLDITGAGMLALGLLVNEDEAIRMSGHVATAFYDVPIPTRDELLSQPAVRDRLTQARRTKWGYLLLVLGFLGQLGGTWLS